MIRHGEREMYTQHVVRYVVGRKYCFIFYDRFLFFMLFTSTYWANWVSFSRKKKKHTHHIWSSIVKSKRYLIDILILRLCVNFTSS